MGFKLPMRTAVLQFNEDSGYAGAEVTVKLSVPLGDYFAAMDALQQDMRATFEKFGRDYLVAWNLEDEDGNPIPATTEGMMQVPMELVNQIIGEWSKAVSNPPTPLVAPSASGDD